ncbi:hypothetical protein C8Q80DRAFT_213932 [Daedaleopsis nitida]|nr:hypothetical protein C8Q80DRAFT_213932 [Daedaleopsis nitida]
MPTVPGDDSSIHYGANAWEAAQTIVGIEGVRCAKSAGSLNFTAPFIKADVVAVYLYENISPGPKPQVTCLLDGNPQPPTIPPPVTLHDVAKTWVLCEVTPTTSAVPQNHTLEIRVDSATPNSPFCFGLLDLEISQRMENDGHGEGATTQGSSTSLTTSDSSSSHSTTIHIITRRTCTLVDNVGGYRGRSSDARANAGRGHSRWDARRDRIDPPDLWRAFLLDEAASGAQVLPHVEYRRRCRP